MKFMTATGTTIVDRDLYHLLIQLGPIWKRTEALLTGPPRATLFLMRLSVSDLKLWLSIST